MNRLFDDDNSEDDTPAAAKNSAVEDTKSIQTWKKVAFDKNDDIKPNPMFKNYKNLLDNLLKTKKVTTMYPLVSIYITYDSELAITVTKQNEKAYYVKMYSLESQAQYFEEKVGGELDSYIKLKEVEQNNSGKKYAFVYMDNGVFKLRTFGRQTRTAEEIADNEVNINMLLDLDDSTMPHHLFPDPFITCTFVTDTLLFICLYHAAALTHH